MPVSLHAQPIEPWQLIQDYQQSQTALQGKHGASVIFIGTMRDFNESDDVSHMHLEHYPGMTENYLNKIAQQAMAQWDILDVFIAHRVGEVTPNQPIVVVAVWSAHRAASYEANRFLMEELKARAPFWKKERLTDGDDRWVTHNTPG